MANITTKIILRNDSLARWNAVNPTLSAGEIGLALLENGKYELRVGNGLSAWQDLAATNIEVPVANVTGLSYVEYQLSSLETSDGEQAKFQLYGKTVAGEWKAIGDNALTIPEVDFSEVNAKIDGVSATVNTISSEIIPEAKTELSAVLSAYTDAEIKGLSDEVYDVIEDIKGAVATGVNFIGTVVELKTSDDGTKGLYKLPGEAEYGEAVNGGLALSGDAEFVWSDTTKSWVEFGDTGNLASKDFVSTKIDEVTNKHTEVASEDAKPAEGNVKGDTCVVKTQIGTTGKYSYTAYVWNGTTWAAMDGNYNASNVIFDEDLTYTTGLGVITAPTGGSGTLTTAGKSVEDLFKLILAKESTSVTCDRVPAQSFTAESSNGGKEVGDTFALTDLQYTFKVTDIGSWNATYKGKTADGTSTTDTGVRYSAKIVAQDGTTLTSNTSMTLNNSITYTPTATEFPNLTIEDSYKSYTLSAKYTYTGSTSKPVTNLGNFILSGTVKDDSITNITETGTSYDAGLGAIAAKTTESTLTATAQFRGYRKMHIVTISSDFTELTEDLIVNSPGLHIKAVANTYDLQSGNTTSESNKKIKLVTGTKAVVIALPTTGVSAGRTRSSVLLKSASNTPITESYKEQAQIQISGKVSGQNKAAYNIYMYKPDAIGAGENHTITIG